MSTNIRNWLNASLEENKEAPVKIQEGETPKEDFSTATNEDSGDVDTDKPATAKIDAASDGDEKGKDIDQGHQEVHVPDNDGKVSNEDASDDAAASEEAVSTESSEEEKKDDIDGEDDEKPKHDDSKEVDPDSQHEADVEKPVEAELKTPETGDDQDTPEADDNVKADPKGAQTDEVSSEDHHEAAEQEDAPVEGGETSEAPAEDDVDEVDDMEDDLQAVAKVESDIDHFESVSESLERYYDILSRGMDVNDGVSGETADAIRIGLENLDPMFHEKEVIPAMEAFGQISSRHTATYISMESLSGKMKAVAEATKRGIAKLFEMLKELYNKVRNNTLGLKKKVDKLETRVNGLNGNLPQTVDVVVSNPTKLHDGSKFVGNDLKTITLLKDVGEYVFIDYPKGADKALEGVTSILLGGGSSGLNDLNPDHFDQDVSGLMARFIPKPPKFTTEEMAKRVVYSSPKLPGNMQLKVSHKKADQGARVNMSLEKGQQVPLKSVQVSAMSKRDLLASLKSIDELVQLLNKVQNNARDVKSIHKTANEIMEIFMQDERTRRRKEGERGPTRGFVGNIRSTVTETVRSVVNPNAVYIQYLTATIRAYLAFIELQIEAIEKTEKETKQPA